jgi:hypothetical protein
MTTNKLALNKFLEEAVKNKVEYYSKIYIRDAKEKLDKMLPSIVAEVLIEVTDSENVISMSKLVEFRISKN